MLISFAVVCPRKVPELKWTTRESDAKTHGAMNEARKRYKTPGSMVAEHKKWVLGASQELLCTKMSKVRVALGLGVF